MSSYSKPKAEILIKEFGYLVDSPYYPYGKQGKEFTIKSLSLIEDMYTEMYALKHNEPEEFKKRLKYRVLVKVSSPDNSVPELELDLEDVLKTLGIKHNIAEVRV